MANDPRVLLQVELIFCNTGVKLLPCIYVPVNDYGGFCSCIRISKKSDDFVALPCQCTCGLPYRVTHSVQRRTDKSDKVKREDNAIISTVHSPTTEGHFTGWTRHVCSTRCSRSPEHRMCYSSLK